MDIGSAERETKYRNEKHGQKPARDGRGKGKTTKNWAQLNKNQNNTSNKRGRWKGGNDEKNHKLDWLCAGGASSPPGGGAGQAHQQNCEYLFSIDVKLNRSYEHCTTLYTEHLHVNAMVPPGE